MIKIDWFSEKVRNNYYTEMKKYLPESIVWYGDIDDTKNPYRIDTYKLLCGTKSEVFKCTNIDLYFSLRKAIDLKKKGDLKAAKKEFNKQISSNTSFFKKYTSSYCGTLQSVTDLSDKIEADLDQAMETLYCDVFPNITRKDKQKSLYDLIGTETRAWLMNSLNVECCPYCNRQYITSLNGVPGKTYPISTADLDHFYNKSIFPLFALSLFNFVPSCQVCNSRVKGKRWLDAVYPYDEEFGDNAVFTIDYSIMPKDKSVDAMTALEPVPVPIDISVQTSDIQLKQRIENSMELFRILQVYQSHQKYAGEILWKKHLYSDPAYIDSLRNSFSNLKHFEITEQDLNLFLYGYRLDREHKYDKDRPLSKLTYDLVLRNEYD